MDDMLKHRIRAHRSAPDVYDPPTFEDMADRIEALETENARLREMLDATTRDAEEAEAYAAELETKKLVRPLVWEDADEGMCTKWRAAAFQGHYELVAFEDEDGYAVNFHWGRPFSFWFIQGEPDEWGPTGPKMFSTLEEAKAAAQADYETRILDALQDAKP